MGQTLDKVRYEVDALNRACHVASAPLVQNSGPRPRVSAGKDCWFLSSHLVSEYNPQCGGSICCVEAIYLYF